MKQEERGYQHAYDRQAVYYDAIYEAQGKDYKKEEYMEAFEKAGLQTTYDPQGITGRGLYIGVKAYK